MRRPTRSRRTTCPLLHPTVANIKRIPTRPTVTSKSRAQTAALEPRVARRRTFVLRRTFAKRRIRRQRSKLPHRDGQPTKQQRIEPSAEPEPCGTQRSSSRLDGSSVTYAPESADAFARRVAAGDTKENQQRLAKLARGDDAGNSASDDDESASEVCLPFPPDRWLVGACVLCERGDAGAGRVARIRGLRFGRVGCVGRDVV